MKAAQEREDRPRPTARAARRPYNKPMTGVGSMRGGRDPSSRARGLGCRGRGGGAAGRRPSTGTRCLFADGGEVHAVDNRCPHMGFPLHRGSVQRRHPHLPLAPRPLRPRQRRHLRPVGRRRARLPRSWSSDGDRLGRPAPRGATASRHTSGAGCATGWSRTSPLVLAKSVLALLEADADRRRPSRSAARLRRALPASAAGARG